MIKKTLTIIVFLMNSAHAAFMINTMTGYTSSNDSKTTTDISGISNHVFI